MAGIGAIQTGIREQSGNREQRWGGPSAVAAHRSRYSRARPRAIPPQVVRVPSPLFRLAATERPLCSRFVTEQIVNGSTAGSNGPSRRLQNCGFGRHRGFSVIAGPISFRRRRPYAGLTVGTGQGANDQTGDARNSCPTAGFLRRRGSRDRYRRACAPEVRQTGLRAPRDRPQPSRRRRPEAQGRSFRRRARRGARTAR